MSFSLLADVHEHDWQRHPVDPYSAESVDHTYIEEGISYWHRIYIHTYIHTYTYTRTVILVPVVCIR